LWNDNKDLENVKEQNTKEKYTIHRSLCLFCVIHCKPDWALLKLAQRLLVKTNKDSFSGYPPSEQMTVIVEVTQKASNYSKLCYICVDIKSFNRSKMLYGD